MHHISNLRGVGIDFRGQKSKIDDLLDCLQAESFRMSPHMTPSDGCYRAGIKRDEGASLNDRKSRGHPCYWEPPVPNDINVINVFFTHDIDINIDKRFLLMLLH